MENIINERIVSLRKSMKMNQTEFAKVLGISQVSLSQIELGGGLSSRTLKKVIESFNLNPNWLMSGEGEIYKREEKVDIDPYLKEQLLTFKGVVIGKVGMNIWKEIAEFYPKYKVSV
jgi:transcriptional regulator with XRE-family HTH domain